MKPAGVDPRTSGAVLAGGSASRLGGVPKGLLRSAGERVIDRNVRILQSMCAEVFVVANDATPYGRLGVPVVGDLRPAHGPLGGLEAALFTTRTDYVLVVACDMPFVRAELLRMLRDEPDTYDAVVPSIDGRPEPLCARYARRCLAPVRRALDERRLKTTSFLADVETRIVLEAELRRADPDLASFRNVNTAEEARALGVELPEAARAPGTGQPD